MSPLIGGNLSEHAANLQERAGFGEAGDDTCRQSLLECAFDE